MRPPSSSTRAARPESPRASSTCSTTCGYAARRTARTSSESPSPIAASASPSFSSRTVSATRSTSRFTSALRPFSCRAGRRPRPSSRKCTATDLRSSSECPRPTRTCSPRWTPARSSDFASVRTCVSAGESLPAGRLRTMARAYGPRDPRRHRHDRDRAHLPLEPSGDLPPGLQRDPGPRLRAAPRRRGRRRRPARRARRSARPR